MEYTVQKLAKLAGVSGRTLRYYDQIGLLTPERVSESGYRIYGEKEIDKLQQILFYRELGIRLEEIGRILSDPAYDALGALSEYRDKLIQRQKGLALLIKNVEKTDRSEKRND